MHTRTPPTPLTLTTHMALFGDPQPPLSAISPTNISPPRQNNIFRPSSHTNRQLLVASLLNLAMSPPASSPNGDPPSLLGASSTNNLSSLTSLGRAAAAVATSTPEPAKPTDSPHHFTLLISIGIPDAENIPSHVLSIPDPEQVLSYIRSAVVLHLEERLPVNSFPWSLQTVTQLETVISQTRLNKASKGKRPTQTGYPRILSFAAIFEPSAEYLSHSSLPFHFPDELVRGLDMVSQDWFHHPPSHFVAHPTTSTYANCLSKNSPRTNINEWFWASHLTARRPETNSLDGQSMQVGLILHLSTSNLYLMPLAINHFMLTWWNQLIDHIPVKDPDSNLFTTYSAFVDNFGIRSGKFSEHSVFYVHAKTERHWTSLQRIMNPKFYSYSGMKFSIASVPAIPAMKTVKECKERRDAYNAHFKSIKLNETNLKAIPLHNLKHPLLPEEQKTITLSYGIAALVPRFYPHTHIAAFYLLLVDMRREKNILLSSKPNDFYKYMTHFPTQFLMNTNTTDPPPTYTAPAPVTTLTASPPSPGGRGNPGRGRGKPIKTAQPINSYSNAASKPVEIPVSYEPNLSTLDVDFTSSSRRPLVSPEKPTPPSVPFEITTKQLDFTEVSDTNSYTVVQPRRHRSKADAAPTNHQLDTSSADDADMKENSDSRKRSASIEPISKHRRPDLTDAYGDTEDNGTVLESSDDYAIQEMRVRILNYAPQFLDEFNDQAQQITMIQQLQNLQHRRRNKTPRRR